MHEVAPAKARRITWARLLLEQLVLQEYWGQVTFSLERGMITVAHKSETVQPEKLANER